MAKPKIGSNAQFSGPQLGLVTIGSYCYAYSGLKAATNALKTYLEFSTGNKMIIGVLQTNAPTDDDTSSGGVTSATELILNGTKIAILKTDSKDEDMNASETMELLLPPFSTLKVTMIDDLNEPDRYGSMSFVGRVYDA